MTDSDGVGLDRWLDSVGFVDTGLSVANDVTDPGEPVDRADDRDDPWADRVTDVPRLTDAQRSFLSGVNDLADSSDASGLADAEALIIDIPTDHNDVDPFDR